MCGKGALKMNKGNESIDPLGDRKIKIPLNKCPFLSFSNSYRESSCCADAHLWKGRNYYYSPLKWINVFYDVLEILNFVE